MSCGCNQIVPCGCQNALSGCSGGSSSGSGGSFIFNKDLIPISDNVFSIGSPTKRVRNIFLGGDVVLSCTSSIRQMTSDGADICSTVITGGGFALTSRAAVASFYGNEGTLNGSIRLDTGTAAAADFIVNATRNMTLTLGADYTLTVGDDVLFDITGDATFTVDGAVLLTAGTTLILTATTSATLNAGTTFTIHTNGLDRWVFDAAGQLVQNASNGSNIIMTANSTGLIAGVTSLDADVGNPLWVNLVGAGGTTQGLRTIANTSVAGSIGIFGYKTRSTGTDANTIVQSGDELLKIAALGADGVVYRNAAQILFKVDSTPGAGDMPGAIAFLTSSDGGVTPLERWRVDSVGNLLANATNGGNLIITQALTGVLLGAVSLDADVGNQARLAIVGGLATGFGATFFSIGNNATSLAIGGYKTRSTSTDANTIVQSGDELFNIYALGADGTDYEQAAKIVFTVDGTPGNNDMPGAISFYTTPDGSNAPLSRLKIDNAGAINVVTGNLVFNAITGGPQFTKQDIAAAGNSQGTATSLTAKFTFVSGADGVKGVILPATPTPGEMFIIFNFDNAILKLYPGTGDSINQLGANNAASIAAQSMVIAMCYSTSVWVIGEMPGA